MKGGEALSGCPRVLIVGTVPYNRKTTARAFDSYFHGWDENCVAQIFSNTKTPPKGHCGTLFQITDQRMLKKRFSRSIQTGRVFLREELPSEWVDSDLEVGSTLFSKLYQIGSASNAYTHIARGILWKEKFWHSKELDEWLDEFCPECVFLSFSNDYFISEIALYVARRFDIPIVSSIGDDYYFLDNDSANPFTKAYKRRYCRLIDEVFDHGGSAIYIGNKIRDLYNGHFGLDGETVYLVSEVSHREFREMDSTSAVVSYFGNVRMGRDASLCDVADALFEINPNLHLDVYSNESDGSRLRLLTSNPNISFHGSIPYDEVLRKTDDSDVVLVVEGHEKKDIDLSRYSLSTKAADSLLSGANVFAYGSRECGVIEYLDSLKCCTVCFEKNELVPSLKKLFEDKELQKSNYQESYSWGIRNHSMENSLKVFRRVVDKAIAGYEKKS